LPCALSSTALTVLNPDVLALAADQKPTGIRALVQGAVFWLWAHSGTTIPIHGFKSADQVPDNAGALAVGSLGADVMDETARIIDPAANAPPRAR
jgi:aryl-alcohol dehydrogenase-like predicted oxidoreductase